MNKCIARDQKQIIFYKKKKECMKLTEKKTVLTIGYEASPPPKKKKNREGEKIKVSQCECIKHIDSGKQFICTQMFNILSL